MDKKIKKYGKYIEKIGMLLQEDITNKSPLINKKQMDILQSLVESTNSLIELMENYDKLNMKALA